MHKGKVIFLVLLTVLLFYRCCLPIPKFSVAGTYILQPSNNTIDTLFLYNNGTYLQKVYYSSGELFGTNKNTWKKRLWGIYLSDFYNNGDNDLNKFYKPKNSIIAENSLISVGTSMNRRYFVGNIIISINKDLSIYYEKVD